VWDDAILAWIEDPKQRYETDGANQLPIEPFWSTRDRVRTEEILIHAIGKPLERHSQTDKIQWPAA
jgi:hypothetical protein